ncbi:hypothetical protein BGZ67_009696 [Mortierella alpina]|nr:hypothetical protein BGZ67_009696 [Mortierella alpina]
MSQPKRIAEYFFMVGLRDDTDLLPIEDGHRREDVYRDLGGPASDAARVPMVRVNMGMDSESLYYTHNNNNNNYDDDNNNHYSNYNYSSTSIQYTYNYNYTYNYTYAQDNAISKHKYNFGSHRVTYD